MSYPQLEEHFRRIGHLDHAIAILEWDEAVMMPPAAGAERADAVASLHGMRHQSLTDPQLADWLDAAEGQASALSSGERANLMEMRRIHRRLSCLPRDLVEASKKAESASEQAWRHLRAANDWKTFLPLQEEVVARKREVAAVLADALGTTPYQALLDGYEPGMTTDVIHRLFSDLSAFLPGFTELVLERQKLNLPEVPAGPFPVEAQRRAGLQLMAAVGFDVDRGRLDISHHPFCGGVPTDVRITTRYDEADFTSALMGILHEAGHGKYEQGLPARWALQPAGQARGMAMHESQSLLQEMQVSRGLPFLRFAASILRAELGSAPAQMSAFTPDNLFRLATRVERGFIRVDADEVTYPAHVILRTELETALIEGGMKVKEIPEAWDARMKSLLGLSTAGNDRDGCMQDIHWPAGLFGYFPCYTLGALIAAQLFAAARSAISGLDDQIESGDFTALNAWLSQNVWARASLASTEEIVRDATGAGLSVTAFRKHLEARYLG